MTKKTFNKIQNQIGYVYHFLCDSNTLLPFQLENDKLKQFSEEKMNRYLDLLDFCVDYASVKKYFKEYMIILKENYQKDKLIEYSNQIYMHVYCELIEAAFAEKFYLKRLTVECSN